MLSGDPTNGLRGIMNTIAGLEGGTQVGVKNMIDLYNQVLIDQAGPLMLCVTPQDCTISRLAAMSRIGVFNATAGEGFLGWTSP